MEHFWFQGNFGEEDELAPVQGFTTRNGAVRGTAAFFFYAVGGFDTTFKTNAHEDYDFGKRLAAQFPVFMSRHPLVYHNFPTSLRRLLRNYWVRVTLFVPYYLRHRPPLDKTQTSRGEALIRMAGCSVWLQSFS